MRIAVTVSINFEHEIAVTVSIYFEHEYCNACDYIS